MIRPTFEDDRSSLSEAKRQWACAALDVPAGAPPDDVPSLLLDRIEQARFLPSPAARQAIGVLLGPAGDDSPHEPPTFSQAREQLLRDEVERFAETFFDLPIAERRRQWRELAGRCRFWPALRARVGGLEPGLLVDPAAAATESPAVIALAAHLRNLFVLRPTARAALREKLTGNMASDVAIWESAAKRLRTGYVATARIEPGLLDWVSGWQIRKKAAARRGRRRPSFTELRPALAPAGAGNFHWSWLIVIVIALANISRFATDSSRSRPASPPPTRYPAAIQNPHDSAHMKALREFLDKTQREAKGKPDYSLKGLRGTKTWPAVPVAPGPSSPSSPGSPPR
jgi:hypothetical protein